MDKPDCGLCRATHEAFDGGEPNCSECIPALFVENQIPAKIFIKCRDQHIMGFDGPVALRCESVFHWMDYYGVRHEDRDYCFSLVNAAYNNVLKKMRADRKRNTA